MISTLRNVFRSPGTSTSAEVERAISEIDGRISDKTRQHEALSARRVDILIEDEAAASKLRRQVADLGEEVTDLSAARERLVGKLDQARAVEAEQEAKRRYAAAIERRDATVKVLRQRLPKHLKEHLVLIRLIEETRAEVHAANAALPPGTAYIADAEGLVRDRAGIPEVVLDEARETLWLRTDRYPAEQIDITKVRGFRKLGGGRAQFNELTDRVGGQVYSQQTDQIIPCLGYVEVRRTIRAATPRQDSEPLRRIMMPGLRWHDPGYVPPPWHDPSPEDVLRAIERAEASAEEPAPKSTEVRVITTREDLE